MSHGGSGGHGGHGGHGGSGHHGGYGGDSGVSHHGHFSHGGVSHGIYSDAIPLHHSPSGHAGGHAGAGHQHSSMGHSISSLGHAISGASSHAMGIFLNAIASALGLNHGGHGGHGHAPPGAPPGTHHVYNFPFAFAQRQPGPNPVISQTVGQQNGPYLRPPPRVRLPKRSAKPLTTIFLYPALLLVGVALWFCILDSARNAQKNQARRAAVAPSQIVGQGAQFESWQATSQAGFPATNPLSLRPNSSPLVQPEALPGQAANFFANGQNVQFNKAFGCARSAGDDFDGQITEPTIASVSPITPYSLGDGNIASPTLRSQIEPIGELARPSPDERTMATVEPKASFQMYGGPYGGANNGMYRQNSGSLSAYGQPNRNFSQPGPQWPQTNLNGPAIPLGEHQLAPRVVIVGR